MEYGLKDLRTSLDNIDSAIVYLLAERFRLTHKVGVYKKQHHLKPVDSSREAAQLERISELAAKSGLDPAFARKVLQLIIDEVVEHHKKLIAS